jgi:hypothetical protein
MGPEKRRVKTSDCKIMAILRDHEIIVHYKSGMILKFWCQEWHHSADGLTYIFIDATDGETIKPEIVINREKIFKIEFAYLPLKNVKY